MNDGGVAKAVKSGRVSARASLGVLSPYIDVQLRQPGLGVSRLQV